MKLTMSISTFAWCCLDFLYSLHYTGKKYLQPDIWWIFDEKGLWTWLGECLCICVRDSPLLSIEYYLWRSLQFHHMAIFVYFSGCRPTLVAVDDIVFRKPVEIGSLLLLSSQVSKFLNIKCTNFLPFIVLQNKIDDNTVLSGLLHRRDAHPGQGSHRGAWPIDPATQHHKRISLYFSCWEGHPSCCTTELWRSEYRFLQILLHYILMVLPVN